MKNRMREMGLGNQMMSDGMIGWLAGWLLWVDGWILG